MANKLGVGYYLKKMAKSKTHADFMRWSYALNLYLISRSKFEMGEHLKFFEKINKRILHDDAE